MFCKVLYNKDNAPLLGFVPLGVNFFCFFVFFGVLLQIWGKKEAPLPYSIIFLGGCLRSSYYYAMLKVSTLTPKAQHTLLC